MGCYDVYCFVCGCSCYSMNNEFIKDLLENYKEYLKKPNSAEFKYYKDLFKSISKYPNFFEEIKKLYLKTKWLSKCSFLTVDDKLIKNVKEIMCNGQFKASTGDNLYHQYSFNNDTDFAVRNNLGVFIHNNCLQFIKKNYGIDIRFSDLPVYIEKKNLIK